ncbi:MAG: T9SS type A sorting domain-containing protein [candidate division KSB1 bacterium]|nr:T9SS type A sorting domain-containing protein [candidate division KSB1 bacterium]MDZ7288175.1 T9SS type A sorting domain-containing protein [candidate division KSB1 bacterium]MDZ7300312.1 T9SS type A sorting domain-containing protein [candidate division KSB1 bacterium]MDZ7308733.1 T9SS type A sorting domain-containing protein [candidate division KSB1 bacterium]MDZ7351312.1 T9SS type A sorting domain-containing protein [candidate division KSB1 bacterium]
MNLPGAFELRQNNPNPFARFTRFRFRLRQPENVRLELLDLTGRRLRLLLAGKRAAGEHEAMWNGRDEQGILLPCGIYFYRLTTDRGQMTRKMIVY